LITAYSERYIEVNKRRHAGSLIVRPQELILDWEIKNFTDLTEHHLSKIAEFNSEVVLLGTGEKHLFLHPKIFQALAVKGIPIECMTTAAACRTYNILMSEGRNVLAALIL
jgi:uncharacterized protein